MPQPAEVDGGPVTLAPSMFDILSKGLRINKTAEALIIAHQPVNHLSHLKTTPQTTNLLTWTYEDLHNASLRLATSLQTTLKPASTVLTLIPVNLEWTLIQWASHLAKYGITSLDPGLLSQSRLPDFTNLIARISPAAIVVPDSASASLIGTLLDPSILKIKLDTTPTPGWTSFTDHFPEAADIEFGALTDSLDRVAITTFTSGTTAAPKGCPRTVRAVVHSTLTQSWNTRIHPSSRLMLSTASFRVIAPATCLAAWSKGACVVVLPGFSLRNICTAITEYRVTMLLFIPSQLSVLADPGFAELDKSCVDLVCIGGDIVTEHAYRGAVKVFPDAHVQVAHGMSEGGGVFRWPLDDVPFHTGICPVGKVQVGTRLRVVDDGRVVARNEVGELQFCTTAVLERYLDGEGEDSFCDDGGRWFRTGDTGMVDEDGWVYILGRKKDVIKRSGVSITPAGMEAMLSEFLGCVVSIVGVKSEVHGEDPFAVVGKLGVRTAGEVEARVVEMFGKDYALGGVATLHELDLDAFPLNKSAKIMKRELAELVETFRAGK